MSTNPVPASNYHTPEELEEFARRRLHNVRVPPEPSDQEVERIQKQWAEITADLKNFNDSKESRMKEAQDRAEGKLTEQVVRKKLGLPGQLEEPNAFPTPEQKVRRKLGLPEQ